ncbi:MAG: hypothetical protein GX996_01870 [Firmicutes bacterium]|nr:hypothetical protein [Bacillota bacterium]
MPNKRQFSFKLEGSAIKKQSVPFKLLANVLDGIQSTFYCIGLEVAGREAKSRGRIPVEILQACELRRIAEKPGSYEVVAEVASTYQMQLFGFDLGKDTLDKFMKLIDYLSESPNSDDVFNIFPDGLHRRRILRSMEKYCPRKGDEWSLVFNGVTKKNILTYEGHKKIRQLLERPNVEMLTVTGELMRLHLDEHKISILYSPTQRILDCFYDVEIEDFIIDNLKDVIQVTGRVQLDALGHPDKIIDAIAIRELNLSTVKLSKISSSGVTLELAQPFIIEPYFDEKEQEVILEYPEFHIIATGLTREDAIYTFEEDFVWLWKEYAMADDSELSLDAVQLKNTLLALVKE